MNYMMDDQTDTIENNETLDQFHRGGFYLVQPRSRGHRSGMDAMLLGGLVPTGFQGEVADLGAGAGAAGFAVASRCKNVKVTLVERSPFMVSFAKRNIALAENAGLAERLRLISADVTLRGEERKNAGLKDNAFDFAIMNPPFNSAFDRQTPDILKAEAHVMPADMFQQWIRAAAAIVKPSGFLGLIARPQSLAEILEALAGRFGDIKLFAVHARKGEPAIRILVHAKRASKGSLSVMPAFYIHEKERQEFAPIVDAINNGKLGIWDMR